MLPGLVEGDSQDEQPIEIYYQMSITLHYPGMKWHESFHVGRCAEFQGGFSLEQCHNALPHLCAALFNICEAEILSIHWLISFILRMRLKYTALLTHTLAGPGVLVHARCLQAEGRF